MDNPSEIWAKVEAARGFINGVHMSDDKAAELELEAFMSIFHPEVYADRQKMQRIRKARIRKGNRK